MANNPYVNKVEYAGQTLIDLTEDTATPSDVLSGVTFHDRSGVQQTGSVITHSVYDGLDSSSTSDALSANQGRVLNAAISALNPTSATGYLKLPDGTLIEWGKVTGINFSNQIGKSSSFQLSPTYLAGSTVIAIATCDQSDSNDLIFRLGVTASSTTFTWTMSANAATTVNNRSFNWITIGRWKS